MTATRSSTKKHNEDEAKARALQDAAPGEKHRLESPGEPVSKRGKKGEQEDEEKVDRKKTEESDAEAAGEPNTGKADTVKEETAEEPRGHEGAVPSNILEKGIIYFFFRPRVNVESPSGVGDIARSHIILRPIAQDSKIGSGTIGDAGNSRLIAIPKKLLPQSGRDRWTAFVEKSAASFRDVKEQFLKGREYSTKTAGERHTPPANPVGEGVYAITKTGRASHLVYMLTLPEKLGEVQHEIGLKEKGSFVISTKNPKYPGPAGARLPDPPEYTKEVMDGFRDLRWAPSLPEHLDFRNSQILLVGESSGIEKATEPQEEEREGAVEPREELEKLEEEDIERMKDISSSDSERIFQDLEAQASDYPKLLTAF